MGSLASRPKAPATSTQVVYVPSYSPAPSASSKASETSSPPAQSTESDASEEQSKARSESLLKRDRSRFGTVLTGFKGLLSSAVQSPHRKTLLGE
jgi:hypothetical protein